MNEEHRQMKIKNGQSLGVFDFLFQKMITELIITKLIIAFNNKMFLLLLR